MKKEKLGMKFKSLTATLLLPSAALTITRDISGDGKVYIRVLAAIPRNFGSIYPWWRHEN